MCVACTECFLLRWSGFASQHGCLSRTPDRHRFRCRPCRKQVMPCLECTCSILAGSVVKRQRVVKVKKVGRCLPETTILCVLHVGSHAGLCTEPEIRKAAAKLAYSELWAQSLVESHTSSAARERMLEDFWREIELLKTYMTSVEMDVHMCDIEQDLRSILHQPGSSKAAPISWF